MQTCFCAFFFSVKKSFFCSLCHTIDDFKIYFPNLRSLNLAKHLQGILQHILSLDRILEEEESCASLLLAEFCWFDSENDNKDCNGKDPSELAK